MFKAIVALISTIFFGTVLFFFIANTAKDESSELISDSQSGALHQDNNLRSNHLKHVTQENIHANELLERDPASDQKMGMINFKSDLALEINQIDPTEILDSDKIISLGNEDLVEQFDRKNKSEQGTILNNLREDIKMDEEIFMSLKKKQTEGVNVNDDIEILYEQIEDKKLKLEYLQKK
jgi:hypothetical protein